MRVRNVEDAQEDFAAVGIEVVKPKPLHPFLNRDKYVLLPIYPEMPKEHVDLVVEAARRILEVDAGRVG